MTTIKDQSRGDVLSSRLKLERQSRKWSIADLASRASVSRATISKIERGESSPTALILGRLSAAFGLTMSQLLARADATRGQVLKANQQPIWVDPETGFSRRNLSPEIGRPTSLELVWSELPKGKSFHYPAAAFAFIDDQQIVVIQGHLRVQHGMKGCDLQPGDCFRLGPPADVAFENRGSSACQYLIAVLRSK